MRFWLSHYQFESGRSDKELLVHWTLVYENQHKSNRTLVYDNQHKSLDFGVMVTREFLALVLSVRVWQVQQIEWWPNWLRFVIWDHEIAGSSPVHSTILGL